MSEYQFTTIDKSRFRCKVHVIFRLVTTLISADYKTKPIIHTQHILNRLSHRHVYINYIDVGLTVKHGQKADDIPKKTKPEF